MARINRVLVVDRARLDRDLLAGAVHHAPGLVLAGAVPTLLAGAGSEAGCDVVVVRAGSPGTDLVAEVRAAGEVPVVVVATHVDARLVAAVTAAGATAVVSTVASLADVLGRLRGEVHEAGSATPAVVDGHGLTPRELDVLHHLADGMTPQQIARLVDLRLPTVRDHVRALREKLGCATATEVVVVAHRLGLAPHVGRPLR